MDTRAILEFKRNDLAERVLARYANGDPKIIPVFGAVDPGEIIMDHLTAETVVGAHTAHKLARLLGHSGNGRAVVFFTVYSVQYRKRLLCAAYDDPTTTHEQHTSTVIFD